MHGSGFLYGALRFWVSRCRAVYADARSNLMASLLFSKQGPATRMAGLQSQGGDGLCCIARLDTWLTTSKLSSRTSADADVCTSV